jgi:hypothetical protein
MESPDLNPVGDLPPNHPLVLEALKGIISGPISELRTKVDNLITNPSGALRKGELDYNNLLPQQGGVSSFKSNNIAANVLEKIAPIQYIVPENQGKPLESKIDNKDTVVPANEPVVNQFNFSQNTTSFNIKDDSDQMELSLFKPAQIDDLYKKMFDIEGKLDIILKHVKRIKN